MSLECVTRSGRLLVCGKAIEITGAASCNQIGLAAAARTVRAVPRSGIRSATLTIKVSDMSASRVIARPVVAGVIVAIVYSVSGKR